MKFLRNFLIAAVAVAFTACAGTKAAYREADAPSEVAFVIEEQYAATVNEAADLAPSLPENAKQRLKDADKIAKPFVLKLEGAAARYEDVAGADNLAALQNAINEAIFLVADFIRAVKDAASGSK